MNQIQKRVTDFKLNMEIFAKIGEISFFVYYGIMVILKTFGYVSHEKFYVAAFVLALVFLLLKVFTTKYTMREFLILYVLFAISALCWLRVGEKNLMLITLTLWGIKNIDLRDLIKNTFLIRVFGTLIMIVFSCVGIFDVQKSIDTATDFSERVVFALGYDKSNTTFYTIFLILVLFVYLNYERLNFWHFLGTSAICFAAFKVTFCRTGTIVFFGMWALILFDKLCRKKRIYKLFCWQIPVFFLMSLGAMIVYRKAIPTWYQINRMFNGRIEISNNYYKRYGLTLFPKPAAIFWEMNAATIDNLYMYIFVCCGMAVGLCLLFFVTKSQLKLYHQGKTQEIVFITVFAVYAILEQSPLNPVMNPFILLLGNLIYRNFKVREINFERKKETTNFTSA